MGIVDQWLTDRDGADDVSWAGSGAMALTGVAHGPVFAGGGLAAARLNRAGRSVSELARRRGFELAIDGCALLGERAALGALSRQGSRSVGGLAEMVELADGWAAINLARPADVELLPAFVGRPIETGDWPAVRSALQGLPRATFHARALDLGLPFAVVPDQPPAVAHPVNVGVGVKTRSPAMPLVVELASLWAGPLCGDLLARAGCRVVKVETRQRPDGARRGNPAFFDLLNGAKETVVVDLGDATDRALLSGLIHAADVVIDGSRPRVMAQWGIDVEAQVARGAVWVSITGYGRGGDDARRVAFGDDGAVAGGLVVPESPPIFVADAAADPVAGLYAALAVLTLGDEALSGLVSVPLRDAAAYVASGVVWREADPGDAAPPRARTAVGSARRLGIDTAAIRRELT